MGGVGEFLGKLFSGAPGKNQVTLRAYGKLPFYAEYRRLEVSPGAPTTFSHWMDEGRLTWVRSMSDGKVGQTLACRIIARIPDTRDIVVAALWDSRDSLGRVFPFAFFAVCPADALGDDTVQRFTSAMSVFRTFDACQAEVSRLAQGGDFYNLFKRRSVALRPTDLAPRTDDLRRRALEIEAPAWFSAAQLGDGVKPEAWFPGLIQRSQRWKSPEAVGDLALSCPLARGLPFDVQAVIWLQWLSGLTRRSGRDPSLIFSTDPHNPRPALHVAYRELLPNDFQLLTTDAVSYGYVEQLYSPPAANDGAAPTVESPAGSLLDWLARTAPAG